MSSIEYWQVISKPPIFLSPLTVATVRRLKHVLDRLSLPYSLEKARNRLILSISLPSGRWCRLVMSGDKVLLDLPYDNTVGVLVQALVQNLRNILRRSRKPINIACLMTPSSIVLVPQSGSSVQLDLHNLAIMLARLPPDLRKEVEELVMSILAGIDKYLPEIAMNCIETYMVVL